MLICCSRNITFIINAKNSCAACREQHLFEMEIFCNIVNVFTVTFDLMHPCWNKSINVFLKNNKNLLTADFRTVMYLVFPFSTCDNTKKLFVSLEHHIQASHHHLSNCTCHKHVNTHCDFVHHFCFGSLMWGIFRKLPLNKLQMINSVEYAQVTTDAFL